MTAATLTQQEISEFEAATAEYQRDREARLRAPNGWLSLAGLFWLNEGENTLGSSEECAIVLPAPWCPPAVGSIAFDGAEARITLAEGIDATLEADGSPVTQRFLKSDAEGTPDRIQIGPVSLTLIVRGGRHAIRVCNNEAPTRTEFKGNVWYPAAPQYRVNAVYTPYDPPRTLTIVDAIGDHSEVPCPGSVSFEIEGVQCSLDVQIAGDELFINFKDLTCGDTSYPPGRFLYAPLPVDGQTVLDFNQAYTPPCGFTPYATCPLPPAQNHLKVRIPAGERWEKKPH